MPSSSGSGEFRRPGGRCFAKTAAEGEGGALFKRYAAPLLPKRGRVSFEKERRNKYTQTACAQG